MLNVILLGISTSEKIIEKSECLSSSVKNYHRVINDEVGSMLHYFAKFECHICKDLCKLFSYFLAILG